MREAGPPSGVDPPDYGPLCRHIFTDIDNTIVFYFTSVFIPGSVQFLHELRGDMDHPEVRAIAPKVMALSARPNRGVDKPFPRCLFEVADGSDEGTTNIYGGSLYGNTLKDCVLEDFFHLHQDRADRAICRKMGQRKVANLLRWRETHWDPVAARPVVFVGDDGEGDAMAAAELLALGAIQHAFIRRLAPEDPVIFIGYVPEPLTEGPHPGLHHFTDYGEAAVVARDLGLLTPVACARVLAAVARQSQALPRCPLPSLMKCGLHRGSLTIGQLTSPQRWLNRCRLVAGVLLAVRRRCRRGAAAAPEAADSSDDSLGPQDDSTVPSDSSC